MLGVFGVLSYVYSACLVHALYARHVLDVLGGRLCCGVRPRACVVGVCVVVCVCVCVRY